MRQTQITEERMWFWIYKIKMGSCKELPWFKGLLILKKGEVLPSFLLIPLPVPGYVAQQTPLSLLFSGPWYEIILPISTAVNYPLRLKGKLCVYSHTCDVHYFHAMVETLYQSTQSQYFPYHSRKTPATANQRCIVNNSDRNLQCSNFPVLTVFCLHYVAFCFLRFIIFS